MSYQKTADFLDFVYISSGRAKISINERHNAPAINEDILESINKPWHTINRKDIEVHTRLFLWESKAAIVTVKNDAAMEK